MLRFSFGRFLCCSIRLAGCDSLAETYIWNYDVLQLAACAPHGARQAVVPQLQICQICVARRIIGMGLCRFLFMNHQVIKVLQQVSCTAQAIDDAFVLPKLLMMHLNDVVHPSCNSRAKNSQPCMPQVFAVAGIVLLHNTSPVLLCSFLLSPCECGMLSACRCPCETMLRFRWLMLGLPSM